MAEEARVQKRLIEYLREKGCYVIKTTPGPGIPVGCPDIIALYEGWWGAFECKSSPGAVYQPLQRETIEKFKEWSTCYRVYPENLEEVIRLLDEML